MAQGILRPFFNRAIQNIKILSNRFHSEITHFNKMTMQVGESTIALECHVVDLRSDTITKPSLLMRQAMYDADVGDDVFGEDPTTIALEKKAASLMGKEAALFVPSGTMANLLAIMVHCDRRGCEIIVGDKSHIFKYEQGSSAQIAGVQICTIRNKSDGTFDLGELIKLIRRDDCHEPETALVCVENTHNICGGKVLPLQWLNEVAHITKKFGIPMHMDGARLFNASVYQEISPARITRDFASVSFCLSKGLSAPIGSLLVGSESFIKRARRMRKALGGGMRQTGVIAAAGLIAISPTMINRLSEDHDRARKIAKAIVDTQSKNVTVDLNNVHTNIILVTVDPTKLSSQDLCNRLSSISDHESKVFGNKATIIRAFPTNEYKARFVTHGDLSDADVEAAIEKLNFVIEEIDNTFTIQAI